MHSQFNPVERIDGDYSLGLILICDHARNRVPPEYGDLGLEPEQFRRHIAYDIGARAVTLGLASRLGVPAVMTTFSRLLVDPNRGEDDPTVVMRIADGAIVHGNNSLKADDIERRLSRYYRPYHQAVDEAIDRCFSAGIVPALFSVHSFTHEWRGSLRPWQVALLWDSDPRFTEVLMAEFRHIETLVVGDNEPYDGALKNDSMYRHGTARGLANTLIEIRQDLIEDEEGADRWAALLAPLVKKANGLASLHQVSHFGSRTGMVDIVENPPIGNRIGQGAIYNG